MLSSMADLWLLSIVYGWKELQEHLMRAHNFQATLNNFLFRNWTLTLVLMASSMNSCWAAVWLFRIGRHNDECSEKKQLVIHAQCVPKWWDNVRETEKERQRMKIENYANKPNINAQRIQRVDSTTHSCHIPRSVRRFSSKSTSQSIESVSKSIPFWQFGINQRHFSPHFHQADEITLINFFLKKEKNLVIESKRAESSIPLNFVAFVLHIWIFEVFFKTIKICRTILIQSNGDRLSENEVRTEERLSKPRRKSEREERSNEESVWES